MGYDGDGALATAFDLETIAHPEAAAYLPPPEVEYLTPPKNYTNPFTIEKWKLEEKTRRQLAYEDALDKCALDPDLCRIVALGFMRPAEREPTVLLCRSEADEAQALDVFWNSVKRGFLVGFNCVAFDIPVLLRRSLLLGVQAPGMDLSKYRHPTIADLMQILSFGGMLSYRKLSFYLKRFGLDVPTDDITGADIAQLVHDGNWDAVRHHCASDVRGTMLLARHIGVVAANSAAEVI